MIGVFCLVIIHERVETGQVKWSGRGVAIWAGGTTEVYEIMKGVDKLNLHWCSPSPAMQEFDGSQ